MTPGLCNSFPISQKGGVAVLCPVAVLGTFPYPVLLLLLFKYLGATLTENGELDAEMAHIIQSEWEKNWKRGYSRNKFEGQGESSPLYKTVVRQAMVYGAGTCALGKAREEVRCG